MNKQYLITHLGLIASELIAVKDINNFTIQHLKNTLKDLDYLIMELEE